MKYDYTILHHLITVFDISIIGVVTTGVVIIVTWSFRNDLLLKKHFHQTIELIFLHFGSLVHLILSILPSQKEGFSECSSCFLSLSWVFIGCCSICCITVNLTLWFLVLTLQCLNRWSVQSARLLLAFSGYFGLLMTS